MIGWGGEKLLGHLYYWGGLTGSLPQLLVNHGYQVFQPALSCSSNWERACELYAQIKGTRVDYGVAHAKKYGHARFGKDFTGAGLDPAWGSPGHKVHFIGHSMGGPTTQLLISLLQMGSKEEVQAAAAAAVPVSPLFLTNKSASQFVSGFFSISGVLQGTPAKEIIDDWSGFVIHFIQHLTMIKDLGSIGKLWDFQLGHWGLEQKSDESILSYVKRIFKSDWANGTSNAAFDLSITGSRDPARAPSFAQPGVYYFSVPTSTTDKKPNGEYVPRLLTTLPFLIPTASAIGRINDPKLLGSDSASWRDNDGLVPVKSSSSDAAGFIDFAVDLRSSPLKLPLAKPITGKYHNTGIIEMDHGGVVGMTDLLAMMHCSSLFLNMARILLSLPR
ncbi:Alpha/Beta hydrolase protein [Cladochytrium replicatum]|nr:Alpha/Beta hydrolase protein [Cladochytrium replicatum]